MSYSNILNTINTASTYSEIDYHKKYLKYKSKYINLKGGVSERKGPTESATLYKIGTKKTGNDGNKWIIAENTNGIKRWKLYKKVEKSYKIRKSKPEENLIENIDKVRNLVNKLETNPDIKSLLKLTNSINKISEITMLEDNLQDVDNALYSKINKLMKQKNNLLIKNTIASSLWSLAINRTVETINDHNKKKVSYNNVEKQYLKILNESKTRWGTPWKLGLMYDSNGKVKYVADYDNLDTADRELIYRNVV